jgi:hypothetical protein
VDRSSTAGGRGMQSLWGKVTGLTMVTSCLFLRFLASASLTALKAPLASAIVCAHTCPKSTGKAQSVKFRKRVHQWRQARPTSCLTSQIDSNVSIAPFEKALFMCLYCVPILWVYVWLCVVAVPAGVPWSRRRWSLWCEGTAARPSSPHGPSSRGPDPPTHSNSAINDYRGEYTH